MLKEFKAFAMRGNVVDMAIGIILGAAFGKIVSSLVNDVLMPPLGKVIGNVNFASLFISLSRQPFESLETAKAAGAATINYGLFINTVVDFVLVAFMIFLVVKGVNRMQPKPAPAPPPATRPCPECLSDIPPAAKRCAHCTAVLIAG